MRRGNSIRRLERSGTIVQFLADVRGATAVEFAIIVSLVFVVIFGVLGFALAWWEWNSVSAAAEVGVRFAVESDPVAEYFNGSLTASGPYVGYNGVVDGGFAPGTTLTTTELPAFTIACTGSGTGGSTTVTCSCGSGGTCPPTPNSTSSGTNYTTADTNAFCAILQQMRAVSPLVTASNLEVDYSHIGLGYAGRDGINIIPAVTVKLSGVQWLGLSFLDLGTTIPAITTTLTAEDLSSCGPDQVCTPTAVTCP